MRYCHEGGDSIWDLSKDLTTVLGNELFGKQQHLMLDILHRWQGIRPNWMSWWRRKREKYAKCPRMAQKKWTRATTVAGRASPLHTRHKWDAQNLGTTTDLKTRIVFNAICPAAESWTIGVYLNLNKKNLIQAVEQIIIRKSRLLSNRNQQLFAKSRSYFVWDERILKKKRTPPVKRPLASATASGRVFTSWMT